MVVMLVTFIFGDVSGARPMIARCQWCMDSINESLKQSED